MYHSEKKRQNRCFLGFIRYVSPQVLIYQAFGWDTPDFAHISLILAADKSKLSKRHGATSVGEFKERGYLAPAMINFLSLLGWNDGTEQELFTRDELKEKFSLDRVNKSAAVFDTEKLVRSFPSLNQDVFAHHTHSKHETARKLQATRSLGHVYAIISIVIHLCRVISVAACTSHTRRVLPTLCKTLAERSALIVLLNC